ncbi:MAG: class I SAM-dependent methyltransferase [Burkholderiales bacterium]|nr:class I SAM-dependent methyltransferase [Burkholderiales bacterium]
MNITEKATILHYHRSRMQENPGTVFALGYRSGESQTKRFEALTSSFDINGCAVLDIGCGHGDLKGFLDARFHGFGYVGIDMMAEFVLQARALHGNRPSCYFCVADLETAQLPKADYVFASGILGYRSADPAHHFSMIEKMYGAAGKALAFNMLDRDVFPDHPLLIGHDMTKVKKFCEGISGNVSLVRGYLEDDFTMVLCRD